ncbi:hypothetical protein HHK36_033471 [Tetracentron sinense]|uniref:Uncharacterized protein n=1 Tax=Tetracentron sinense TaxID=13715 RepID=A0A835CYP3_TETSI|nr:hypothetical protein HHK36_033471 [Tetracentron sinense]
MRLNQVEASASPPVKRAPAILSVEWGLRLPRSRQILRCSIVHVKKEGESTRASPTTPLSWSGGTGTSLSGGAVAGDGYEESSLQLRRSSAGRSKATATNETIIRRSRKKKTFSELKEEESLLLKERICLKKELAKLRITFEEERARNGSLKRMKRAKDGVLGNPKSGFYRVKGVFKSVLYWEFCTNGAKDGFLENQSTSVIWLRECSVPTLDLHLQSAKKTGTASEFDKPVSDKSHFMEVVSVHHAPPILPTNVTRDELDVVVCPPPASDFCKLPKKDVAAQESFFVLPDLNFPFEENAGSELLYGMS